MMIYEFECDDECEDEINVTEWESLPTQNAADTV
jgi:hypothetical protein